MILKEQLQLLKGKYVKVGARMAFWYCEICDDNIEAIMDDLSNKEHKRITRILEATKNALNNFEEIWEQKAKERIERLKRHHEIIIEKHVKEDIGVKITELKAELKKKGKKLSKDKLKELKETLTLEYTPKYKKEYKKAHKEALNELINVKIPNDKEENYKDLTNMLNKYTKLVKSFKPYLERKVKEVYPSIVDENTVIIRVTGYEQSKYWDREEYNKVNNPYKVGERIRIIDMKDEPHYNGREGVITHIDSLKQLHGTWGGLAVVLSTDKVERCNNE